MMADPKFKADMKKVTGIIIIDSTKNENVIALLCGYK